MDKGFFDRASQDFAARRAQARKLLDSLDPAMQGGALPEDPSRRAWFESVYALAKGDPARVPWADLSPHPLSKAWVATHAKELSGLRVLDVGCGLGDNAECFAAVGAHVTAFDFVDAADAWAKRRFPASKVTYCQGDLFALPDAWHENFDLVHECYTLQALSPALLPQALAALRSTLALGGKLLIVARATDEACVSKSADDTELPPWRIGIEGLFGKRLSKRSFFAVWAAGCGSEMELSGQACPAHVSKWSIPVSQSRFRAETYFSMVGFSSTARPYQYLAACRSPRCS